VALFCSFIYRMLQVFSKGDKRVQQVGGDGKHFVLGRKVGVTANNRYEWLLFLP